MARVVGVGGVFLYAADVDGVRRWYREHLGIDAPLAAEDCPPWHEFVSRDERRPEQRRRLVWSVLPKGSQITKGAAVSYHVDDIATMVRELVAAGVDVDGIHDLDYGRFAYVTDPEGNRIELFEDKKL